MDSNASLACVWCSDGFFAFFGLQESSVMDIRVDDFRVLTLRKCEIIVRKVKRRTFQEALRCEPGVYAVPEDVKNLTALKVSEKFFALRSSSSEYLFPLKQPLLDGSTGVWRFWLLHTEYMLPNLVVCIRIIRFWGHWRSVYLWGSFVESLANYYWSYSSEGLCSVYFDHIISLSLSAASLRFFGAAESWSWLDTSRISVYSVLYESLVFYSLWALQCCIPILWKTVWSLIKNQLVLHVYTGEHRLSSWYTRALMLQLHSYLDSPIPLFSLKLFFAFSTLSISFRCIRSCLCSVPCFCFLFLCNFWDTYAIWYDFSYHSVYQGLGSCTGLLCILIMGIATLSGHWTPNLPPN